MKALTVLSVFLVLMSFSLTYAKPKGADVDGRIGIRTLYSSDGVDSARDVLFSIVDIDLRASKLTASNFGLLLDSRFIWDDTKVNERRFGNTESIPRVRQGYLVKPFAPLNLTFKLGRILIAESGNAWVDGGSVELKTGDQTSVGIYGGLRPNPIDYELTTVYKAAGAYAKYRSGTKFDTEGGLNLVLRENIDRQFVFHRSHYRPNRQWSFFNYSILEMTNDPEFSTLLAGMTYRQKKGLTLNLNLSRYAVEQYRNAIIFQNVVEPNQALLIGNEVINLVYNRMRLSLSYRFWQRFYAYQSLELKQRSQDNRRGATYTLGMRNDDFFDMSWDLRAIIEQGYLSDSWLLATSLDGRLSPTLSWTLHGTALDARTIDRFTERGRTFDEAQKVYLIGAAMHWRIQRLHYLALIYDYVLETELQDARNQGRLHLQTVMGRYQIRF